MPETKTKKPAAKRPTRAKKAAHSPAPTVSAERKPSVRYCGPTSHPSHHHASVAAEGTKHYWAASIIAGLAIVVTASVAFSAVQAKSDQQDAARSAQVRGDVIREIRALNDRIDAIEERVEFIGVRLSQ